MKTVLTTTLFVLLAVSCFAATAVRPPQPKLTAQQKYDCEFYKAHKWAKLNYNFFDSSDDAPNCSAPVTTETLEVETTN